MRDQNRGKVKTGKVGGFPPFYYFKHQTSVTKMQKFKVVFANNKAILCKPADSAVLGEKDNLIFADDISRKQLIYVMLLAENEAVAIQKAEKFAEDYLNSLN